jgi:hypothetical protein
LADVEQAKRNFDAHVSFFVCAQIFVVTARLKVFIVEILDGLVVQQTVDRECIGPRIEFIGQPADSHAPFRHDEGERQVNDYRSERDRREPPVEAGHQNHRNQREFQNHRNDGKQHVGQKRGDSLGTAFYVARHAAGLALQVEAQTETVQVSKHTERNATNRAPGDAHENNVTQFREQGRRQPQRAIDQQQCEWQGHRLNRGVQCIDNFLHHQRYADVGELGDHQKYQRDRHPPAELQQVWEQHAHDAPVAAGRIV